MIQIRLKDIHCSEETDEVGADEPYVIMAAVNLASTVNVAGFPVPLPAFEVVRYGPFEDMDQGETHFTPGDARSFWGLNGGSATLTNPDDVIFVAGLMENDDGDPEVMRGIVKGIVGGSVLGSLTFNRNDKVTKLINDVNSALGTPTGAPNFDDQVGFPQELRFTQAELSQAESGQTVVKTLTFNGDGGKYDLTFETTFTGWLHNVPGAGQVPVAPGTRPTSWYTTPENVQHIAYAGTDGHIHECFFFIGGDNVWHHSVPSAGQVPVAPGTSPTSWDTTPENVQHIAYVGTDGFIHECFYFIGGDNIWHHSVPGAGQMPVAPGTSPTSWYTTPENVQHIAYAGTDGLIHECFYFIGGDNIWHHNIPGAGQVPVAPATSPTSWYTTPENVQHIAYVGTDGLIHECFFFIGGDNIWRHNVPNAGQMLAEPGTSPTSWYTTPENVQHIAYVGTDKLIHECFFFIH